MAEQSAETDDTISEESQEISNQSPQKTPKADDPYLQRLRDFEEQQYEPDPVPVALTGAVQTARDALNAISSGLSSAETALEALAPRSAVQVAMRSITHRIRSLIMHANDAQIHLGYAALNGPSVATASHSDLSTRHASQLQEQLDQTLVELAQLRAVQAGDADTIKSLRVQLQPAAMSADARTAHTQAFQAEFDRRAVRQSQDVNAVKLLKDELAATKQQVRDLQRNEKTILKDTNQKHDFEMNMLKREHASELQSCRTAFEKRAHELKAELDKLRNQLAFERRNASSIVTAVTSDGINTSAVSISSLEARVSALTESMNQFVDDVKPAESVSARARSPKVSRRPGPKQTFTADGAVEIVVDSVADKKERARSANSSPIRHKSPLSTSVSPQPADSKRKTFNLSHLQQTTASAMVKRASFIAAQEGATTMSATLKAMASRPLAPPTPARISLSTILQTAAAARLTAGTTANSALATALSASVSSSTSPSTVSSGPLIQHGSAVARRIAFGTAVVDTPSVHTTTSSRTSPKHVRRPTSAPATRERGADAKRMLDATAGAGIVRAASPKAIRRPMQQQQQQQAPITPALTVKHEPKRDTVTVPSAAKVVVVAKAQPASVAVLDAAEPVSVPVAIVSFSSSVPSSVSASAVVSTSAPATTAAIPTVATAVTVAPASVVTTASSATVTAAHAKSDSVNPASVYSRVASPKAVRRNSSSMKSEGSFRRDSGSGVKGGIPARLAARPSRYTSVATYDKGAMVDTTAGDLTSPETTPKAVNVGSRTSAASSASSLHAPVSLLSALAMPPSQWGHQASVRRKRLSTGIRASPSHDRDDFRAAHVKQLQTSSLDNTGVTLTSVDSSNSLLVKTTPKVPLLNLQLLKRT
eukprot:TRINITY_DN2861_c0_g3_i1.p1 TRINITY_DN2861_c0_g3~~TRINITY_DN2861_c0_g3_i1.p1  ORF type:complete len:895 (+),score=210.09 TRINITY_DN2861_c0_g3_i1:48-2687(+)